MTAQEVLHRLIEEELQIERSRPGQGHHEAAQRALCTAHHHRAKRRPVDLRLLTTEDLQTQKRLVLLRAQTRHRTAQIPHTSPVTTIAKHLLQTSGAQTRMGFQRLADEPNIGIEFRRTQLLGTMKTVYLDGPLHGIGMNSERLGDGAHLPVLGIKVAADLYPHLRIDHLCSPARTCARKRIDEAAGAAADHAAHPKYSPLTWPNTQRSNRRHRDRFSTLRW